MRQFIVMCLAALVMPVTSAAAGDCTAEVKGLFQGGPWDPFVVGNRHEVTVKMHPDGSTTPVADVLWDGPVKSINCTPNGCFMGISNQSWSGTSFEGPWTKSPDMGIEDFEAFVRGTADRLADSVQEAECLGETDLDGATATLYRFLSKPEPNEFGSWWGGRYSFWVDGATGRVVRIELADGIASWAPEPTKDVQVTTVTYDDTIRIEPPE